MITYNGERIVDARQFGTGVEIMLADEFVQLLAV